MEEEKDFNDILDDILLSENAEEKQSYSEGYKAGVEGGNSEGFHLGYHKGAQLGLELGYYLGIVTKYLEINKRAENNSEKITAQLEKVKELIDVFPRTNSQEHDILKMADNIRAQYKKACALLKISSNNPFDTDVSF